ncbi:hypothetical protein MFUL124B02_21015 [Myxococcus fulvus 124B02]|nr:hypothetical protein MFUL124B02_21015 [Myxococcus fulvus 124B02]
MLRGTLGPVAGAGALARGAADVGPAGVSGPLAGTSLGRAHLAGGSGPLAAFDELLENLERQASELRKSAATLLALKGELTRAVERYTRRLAELDARRATAESRSDAKAVVVLKKDRVQAEALLASTRESLERAESDGALLLEAAAELGERVEELRRERESASARLVMGAPPAAARVGQRRGAGAAGAGLPAGRGAGAAGALRVGPRRACHLRAVGRAASAGPSRARGSPHPLRGGRARRGAVAEEPGGPGLLSGHPRAASTTREAALHIDRAPGWLRSGGLWCWARGQGASLDPAQVSFSEGTPCAVQP